MAYKKVYDDYFEMLVKILPMDDALFTAKLRTKNLLPDNVSSCIEAEPTRADKAKYFLRNVIKPSLDMDDTEDLVNLISAMEQSELNNLKKIAAKMRSALQGIVS